jgi:hypothetical protein
MKKMFLLLAYVTNILLITAISACPCEFSPDDVRPFFEQYDNKTISSTNDENNNEKEKEKKS